MNKMGILIKRKSEKKPRCSFGAKKDNHCNKKLIRGNHWQI